MTSTGGRQSPLLGVHFADAGIAAGLHPLVTCTIKAVHFATRQVARLQVIFQPGWGEHGEDATAAASHGIPAFTPVSELLRRDLDADGPARPAAAARAVTALLEAGGLQGEDVDVIALTHFQWDHADNGLPAPQPAPAIRVAAHPAARNQPAASRTGPPTDII